MIKLFLTEPVLRRTKMIEKMKAIPISAAENIAKPSMMLKNGSWGNNYPEEDTL